MATEGAEVRTVIVPIDSEARDPIAGGQITYRYNTPDDPAGLFSFSYYFRATPTTANRNVRLREVAAKAPVYVKGMSAYTSLTEREAFARWKTVIYTDRQTLDSLEQLPASVRPLMTALMANPRVIVAVCEWPEFSRNQSPVAIENSILRVMRHKAMADFPEIPTFVRDADTVFVDDLQYGGLAPFVDKLYAWESTMLGKLRESGKVFLVSGVPSYKRQWHVNSRRNFESQGILAGLTCSLGIGARGSEVWQQSLGFIRGRCHIDVGRGVISNIVDKTYIGKDEQILIFIWIPELMNDTFFFYFDFAEYESGDFLRNWAQADSPYHGAYQQLLREFPQWVDEDSGALKKGLGASPYYKFFYFISGRMVGTPPAGTVPNPDRDNINVFEHGVLDGMYVEEEQNLLNMRRNESVGRHVNFFHPIVVSMAFDNPQYNRIMYLMFATNRRRYRFVCSLEGGNRKTLRKRKVRKNRRGKSKKFAK
jgi:hypothetical protein